MTLLFLTMIHFGDGIGYTIYTDLMRKFRDEGHEVYVVYPLERRFHIATNVQATNGMHILGVRTLNVQKTNVIEKGLGQVLIEPLFKRAIGKYFKGVKFDLILYSTPPITFVDAIKFVRRHNPDALTYLMLKDIFPQNAVDLGMLSKSGFLYRQFRRKEKELYRISDYIGCMSPANVRYVLEHNPEVPAAKVGICPNSFEVLNPQEGDVRAKYGLPLDRPIFFYGGNLGKPQGIPFLINCLKANATRSDCHFLVVGDGFDYPKLRAWYDAERPGSVTVLRNLPKADYDQLAASCDVGLIFLDYRFTIPNYPSRLLACLMAGKPIIACTDPNCDTGPIAEANGYGYWCPSNSVESFTEAVDRMLASDMKAMGQKGYEFFLANYTVEKSYDAIVEHCESERQLI